MFEGSSAYTCSECGAVLREQEDQGLIEFRCRAGHAFSAGWLLTQQSDAAEAELSDALRALKDQDDLARRLTGWARAHGDAQTALRFEEQAQDAEQRADLVRAALRPADERPTRRTRPSPRAMERHHLRVLRPRGATAAR